MAIKYQARNVQQPLSAFSTVAYIDKDGIEGRLVTWELDDFETLVEVVSVVEQILKVRRQQFFDGRAEGIVVATKLGERIVQCLRRDYFGVANRLRGNRLHPYFRIFCEISLAYGGPWSNFRESADVLNRFIQDVREGCSTKRVRWEVGNAKRCRRSNKRSLLAMLSGAVRCPKVLVLRIEFEYLIQDPRLRPNRIDLKTVWRHRKEILKYIRVGPYGQFLVGYASKTEWGEVRGPHHHVLVVLDGRRVRADITIAAHLCAHWKHVVTGGLGASHNCNMEKHHYPRCGIGMISKNDKRKIGYLFSDVAPYLYKTDTYVRSLVPKGFQCFNVGGPYDTSPAVGTRRRRVKWEDPLEKLSKRRRRYLKRSALFPKKPR